jgi:hypothetical protein
MRSGPSNITTRALPLDSFTLHVRDVLLGRTPCNWVWSQEIMLFSILLSKVVHLNITAESPSLLTRLSRLRYLYLETVVLRLCGVSEHVHSIDSIFSNTEFSTLRSRHSIAFAKQELRDGCRISTILPNRSVIISGEMQPHGFRHVMKSTHASQLCETAERTSKSS